LQIRSGLRFDRLTDGGKGDRASNTVGFVSYAGIGSLLGKRGSQKS
jgi:hypothetical protein